MTDSCAFHVDDIPPDLSPEAQQLVDSADRRFKEMINRERFFPDRIGVVLAAGAATRFRPLTASPAHARHGLLSDPEQFSVIAWNKASLPIAGRPLIEFTLRDLVESGFRYIVVNVSLMNAPESIISAAGDGARFGDDVAITFSVEDSPTGTYGGVVGMLEKFAQLRAIPPETEVAIFSGDIYTEQAGFEILRAHRERNAGFTLMLNPISDDQKIHFGTVELDQKNRIVTFHEKRPDSRSNLNNSSRYIAKYELLMRWADELTAVPIDKDCHKDESCFFDFGLHIFSRKLAELNQVGFYGFVSDKIWADLGRIADFHDVNLEFLKTRVVNKIHPDAKMTQNVNLSGNYHIDAGAYVNGHSRIQDSIIGSGWNVEASNIKRSILMPLPPGMQYTIGGDVSVDRCVIACGDVNQSQNEAVVVYNGQKNIINKLR